MKNKNVWMPMLAFLVAIGMAFATTPVNEFEANVWRKETPTSPCHPSTCVTTPGTPCDANMLYFEDKDCESQIDEAYEPN